MNLSGIPHHDGTTYSHPRDGQRPASQQKRVIALMLDSKWRSLREIREETGYPEASISARLRDARKPRFGGYKVERRYVERGLWVYRLVTGQLELV